MKILYAQYQIEQQPRQYQIMSDPLSEVLQRVRTYKLSVWPYHDIPFTPYQLSSNGYQVTKLNHLQCTICHHTVIVEEEHYQTLPQLVESHSQTCIYKGEPMHGISKEELYLKMDDISSQLKASFGNAQNPKKNVYPVINIDQFLKFIGAHRHTLFKVLTRYGVDQQHIPITFLLQFMGWRYISLQLASAKQKNSPIPMQDKLECLFCGRIVDIKDYKSTEEDKQCRDPDKQKDTHGTLDIVDEHRYFCLWSGSGIQGWEVYLQHLWDKIGESDSIFKRQRPEQTQKIRVRMDGYLQNFQIRTRELFEKVHTVMDDCKNLSSLIEGEQAQLQAKNAATKKLLEEFNKEVDEQVHQPLKKIKLS